MRETQYTRILNALRKAGNKGCTVRDLLQFSSCPWKRIDEMTWWRDDWITAYHGNCDPFSQRIERHERQHNGRTIRVYVLKRVK